MKLAGCVTLLCLLGCGAPGASASGADAAAVDVPAADVPTTDVPTTDVPATDAAASADVDDPEVRADRAFRALIGRFDSQDQAARDPRFLAIQLLTCAVSVPELGPRVMYVEQARADALNAPYRQRLYVVEPTDDGRVRSRVFEFHTPTTVVGLCADPEGADVRPKDVVEREGCAVLLRPVGDRFEGGTEGRSCESTLMGARYATSEVVLRDDGLDSWDRGYDAQDRQVWGATAGAYRFVRRTPPR